MIVITIIIIIIIIIIMIMIINIIMITIIMIIIIIIIIIIITVGEFKSISSCGTVYSYLSSLIDKAFRISIFFVLYSVTSKS